MSETFDLKDIGKRMDGAVSVLKQEFAGLRTGRASASLLDPVTVEVYGATMPINQVATVSVPEARMISVQVWDKSQVAAVEKAIREAELGAQPGGGRHAAQAADPRTQRRAAQGADQAGAQVRRKRAVVAVRNVRRDGNDTLKRQEKDKEIGQDEQHTLMDQVQELTDNHIKAIDDLLEHKETEIMQV